jgi:hypothetical protein
MFPADSRRERERKAGSSATRNKLAAAFQILGVDVEPSEDWRPPTDADFAMALVNQAINGSHLLCFRRGHEQFKIRIPALAIFWLKFKPGEKYTVLDVDIATAGYRGEPTTYVLSWKDLQWVLLECTGNKISRQKCKLLEP